MERGRGLAVVEVEVEMYPMPVDEEACSGPLVVSGQISGPLTDKRNGTHCRERSLVVESSSLLYCLV